MKHGLTPNQFAVLEVLYHRGCLCIGEIIESILISGGNITVVAKNLEKSGLLTFEQDENDKRKRLLKITEDGEKLIKIVFEEHLVYLDSLFSVYDEAEKRKMISIANKILKGGI